jgi:hypothetical protein
VTRTLSILIGSFLWIYIDKVSMVLLEPFSFLTCLLLLQIAGNESGIAAFQMDIKVMAT